MKTQYIERCYECKYCAYDSEYSCDMEGSCMYFKPSKDIRDVTKIPKWCPLEDVNH